MLKEIMTVDGVGHSFEVANDSLFVITLMGDCDIYQGLDSQSNTTFKGNFSDLGVFSDKEIYLSEGFTSRIIHLDSLESRTVAYKVDAVRGDRIIASEKQERTRYLSSRLKSGEIEWKIQLKRGKHLVLGQKVLVISKYLDDGEICAYDLTDGSLIWTYDVTKSGIWKDYDERVKSTEVARLLGMHQGRIYVYLNSGKVLILDVKSGNRIALLENDKHSKFDTFGNSIELDVTVDKLIQLASQDLIEVDLKSLEVCQTSIEDMKSSGLKNFSLTAFDSGCIYFTDKNNQTIGALNRATKKIEWIHKLTQEGVVESEQPRYGRELKLRGNRLYVLDNKNRLHIFEKEDHLV